MKNKIHVSFYLPIPYIFLYNSKRLIKILSIKVRILCFSSKIRIFVKYQKIDNIEKFVRYA